MSAKKNGKTKQFEMSMRIIYETFFTVLRVAATPPPVIYIQPLSCRICFSNAAPKSRGPLLAALPINKRNFPAHIKLCQNFFLLLINDEHLSSRARVWKWVKYTKTKYKQKERNQQQKRRRRSILYSEEINRDESGKGVFAFWVLKLRWLFEWRVKWENKLCRWKESGRRGNKYQHNK